MNSPELLRQIATVMEQDPDGWWYSFEWRNRTVPTLWHKADWPEEIFQAIAGGYNLRLRPRTVRIDVEMAIRADKAAQAQQARGGEEYDNNDSIYRGLFDEWLHRQQQLDARYLTRATKRAMFSAFVAGRVST